MRHAKYSDSKQNPVYLLFWPVFGLRYLIIENFNPAETFHTVRCALDDCIPFVELFLIPYVLWYFCIIGVHFWLFIGNDPAYRQYSWYLIFTTVISTVVFLLYPTCQDLRIAEFPRNNSLTEAVSLLYRLDTNTNVCPSEHVILSAGYFFAMVYSDASTGKRCLITGAAALLTALATVFLKQHSAIDVIAAIPVCGAGWYAAFWEKDNTKAG